MRSTPGTETLPPLDGAWPPLSPRELVGRVGGRLTANAPLAPLLWFKCGGNAEWLFEPDGVDDLCKFLRDLDPNAPVWPLGLGSNLIVRDGGLPGVVIRLGKAFAKIWQRDGWISAGAGAPGIAVASAARDWGIAGFEFLRGIPGTVGGAVRMNAGAYGRDLANVLQSYEVVNRRGEHRGLSAERLRYSYRHSVLPADHFVVGASLFTGEFADPATIGAEMDRIAAEREASQPLRSRTGGSTFKNPPGHKAWALIDAAGCRGFRNGDAQVSEKHCNFLLNLGQASSAEIEALGEEVRARVLAHSGVTLEWEIQRVGVA